jgi:hypothetical protein
MAKHADGPKSGRTGFGYQQSRGLLPWQMIRPHSTREMVQTQRKQREERELLERCHALAQKYPAIRDEAKRKGLSPLQTLRWLISHDRERERRHKALLNSLKKGS